jgi:hypothetical protein
VFARFGDADAERLDAFVDASRKDILSDLLQIRNPVAHGESIGGAKIDPARYIELCEDFYEWCVTNYLSD